MNIKILLPISAIVLLLPSLAFAKVADPALSGQRVAEPVSESAPRPPDNTIVSEVAEPLLYPAPPQAMPDSHFGSFIAGWFVTFFVILILLYKKISPKTPTKKVFYWAIGLCVIIFLSTLAGSLSNKMYASSQMDSDRPSYQNTRI